MELKFAHLTVLEKNFKKEQCVRVCVANNITCLYMVLFQHRMFTAIHKHYSVDAWKEFAAKNKEAIKVRHI